MKFICDNTVGKLARYLRMFGFDVSRCDDYGESSEQKQGIGNTLLLTKKTGSTPHRPVFHIHSNKIVDQMREVGGLIRPHIDMNQFLGRCLHCNSVLTIVSKNDVEGRVPEYVYHHNTSFKLCPDCGKVYWHGTHAERMSQWKKILDEE